jgi:hypothetical protein
MKIGFTGTQHGMTRTQADRVIQILSSYNVTECHHGDCVGADADFHSITFSKYSVHIHPPANPIKRAFCAGNGVVFYREKDYIARNH